MKASSLSVAIAVPLEKGLVAAIRAAHPATEVLYQPELLPPERYPADHTGDPRFQRTQEQEARYWQMLLSADILYGFPNNNAEGLAKVAANPQLRWIHATAAGAGGTVRQAQLSPAQLKRLIITSSAGVHVVPLAEFALMGVLNGFKHVAELAVNQAARHWPEYLTVPHLVRGSHLVIAGLGEIGLETARLARALGMTVSGTKRTVTAIDGILEVSDSAGLTRLVANADAFITILPGTADTENLISAPVFAAMKPGTVFVNVGRGTVVDEEALLAALNNGQVSYACLDVFAVEPLPVTSPLWEHPRVLVSPHSAALSLTENQLITERFIENLRRYQNNAELLHVVDPHHFY